jgi:hypothetical protein
MRTEMHTVYNIASTMEVARYLHAGWAMRKVQTLNKKHPGEYAWTTTAFYNKNIVKKKKVRTIFGQEVEIASNTPRCCDPSSELYWSM